MRKIFILSTILTFLLFGFAMYKYTHHPDSRRAICGYNFKYPENSEKYLKFFVKMDLEKFVNLDDKIINLNNKTVVTREIVKKGQKRCLLAFSLSLPVIFWVFTCSLMTLTPWGWRLGFWKKKFDLAFTWGEIIIPLLVILPLAVLVFFIIFLYKLLLNIY